MIIGSIVLILVAFAFFGLGLTRESETLYYSSIAASALSAFALVVGIRTGGTPLVADDDLDVGGDDPDLPATPIAPPRRSIFARRHRASGVSAAGRGEVRVSDHGRPAEHDGADVPQDEPPEQAITSAAAARVARLGAPVAVIDGRPRFHQLDCLHLLGRQVERLPAREAVELGFTPCGHCEPATALFVRAPRS